MVVLLLMLACPALAQFRQIEVRFQDSGCASCVESLQSRLQRIRGVERVSAGAADGIVFLGVLLAGDNRVRLQQVRDFIEQGGNRILTIHVDLKGAIRREGESYLVLPAGGPQSYPIDLSALGGEGRKLLSGASPDAVFRLEGDLIRPAPGASLPPIRVRGLARLDN